MFDLKKLLFVGACLLVAVCAGYFWLVETSASRLERALTELVDTGEPIVFAQLAPPEVPADENAAPVLIDAVAAFRRLEPVERDALERFAEQPFERNDHAATVVRGWIDDNDRALRAIARAAARPACRFDLDYGNVFDLRLPSVLEIMEVSDVLVARALVRARDGAVFGALEDCRIALRVAAHAGSDPVLILAVARAAIEREVIDALAHIAARHRPSDDAFGGVVEELARIDPGRDALRALRAERCFGIAAFEAIRDPGRFADTLGVAEKDVPSAWRMIPEDVFAAVVALDEAWYFGTMGELVELAREPSYRVKAACDAQAVRAAQRPWYSLATPVVAVFDGFVPRAAAHRAHVDCAILALGGSVGSVDPLTGDAYRVARGPGDAVEVRSLGFDGVASDDDIVFSLPSR